MPNVLLVDDEAEFIPEQVRQALPGHNVTVATNGFEGLAAIGSSRPDVVLLDLGLPDRSGGKFRLDLFYRAATTAPPPRSSASRARPCG